MKKALKNISNIQTGIFAKTAPEGEIVYLQVKHFDEEGRINNLFHPDLKPGNITEKHLLKHGDVLFAAKGTKNFAAVYEQHNPSSVASTSFFVLRLNDRKILPEYLAWFLNNPIAQKFLKGKAKGTAIVSISKKTLEELEVPIPSIEKQNAILEISKLVNEEKKIRKQIETLREKQIQQELINAIK